MAINYPAWVTDGSALSLGVETFIRKVGYTVFACEKLRRLHNAAWKWHRGAARSAEEDDLLASSWPLRYPGSPPTAGEMTNWIEDVWDPKQHSAQAERASLRLKPTADQLNVIDLTTVT